MEIFGIGTDIVEVKRLETLSEAFMQRCFTEREREKLKNKSAESVAGYFAAKEAVAKALGTGFAGFSPSAIEILHDKTGKPEVVLHASAAKIADDAEIKKIVLSISHCKSYATATAVSQS